jgi:Golgi SNAP receptor complex protein 1
MFYLVLLIVYALSLDVIELQEFYRLRSSLRAKKEHASLLDNFKEFDRTRLDLEEGGESEQHTLLKEHASISRNTGHVSHIK